MASENKPGTQAKTDKPKYAWKLLPDVWALIKPRRGILAVGFILMAINRVSGLILPASTKYLVDDVIGKRQIHLLTPIVLIVGAATVVQGLSSFSLTQLLSCGLVQSPIVGSPGPICGSSLRPECRPILFATTHLYLIKDWGAVEPLKETC